MFVVELGSLSLLLGRDDLLGDHWLNAVILHVGYELLRDFLQHLLSEIALANGLIESDELDDIAAGVSSISIQSTIISV